ncbi:MAG: keto-deoxy-phosphogluconate aldolase, partial [Rubrivivax sp.]
MNRHPSAQGMLDLLARTPVMPIIWIHEADTAVGVARALVEGGVTVFEVLLRTPAALQAVEAVR